MLLMCLQIQWMHCSTKTMQALRGPLKHTRRDLYPDCGPYRRSTARSILMTGCNDERLLETHMHTMRSTESVGGLLGGKQERGAHFGRPEVPSVATLILISMDPPFRVLSGEYLPDLRRKRGSTEQRGRGFNWYRNQHGWDGPYGFWRNFTKRLSGVVR